MIAQSAVDYLITQIIDDQTKKRKSKKEWWVVYDKAKEIEKENLNNARIDGINLANKGYGK